MPHRVESKKANRQLSKGAKKRAASERRQKLMRRGGYWAVGIVAAALVGFAILNPSSSKTGPAQQMASMGGEATPGSGPAVGAPAPAFSLTDVTSGKQVTAASLRGRQTLLFFSEGINCQACMVQTADLQKSEVLKKAGIKLVSVTTDPPAELTDASKQYGIHTPMLSDPDGSMSTAYGMLGHGGMQHPTQDGHAFMLIDKNGRISWHQAYQEMYVDTDQLIGDITSGAK